MKYTTRQYASTLHAALKGAPKQKQKAMIRRFFMLLSRDSALPRLPQILAEYERIALRAGGRRKVEIESAAKPRRGMRSALIGILGKRLVISEKVDPGLLAGVRIFVDQELFIDASGKRFLHEMFLQRT